MGNPHLNLNNLDTVSLFSSPQLWLDDNATQQLIHTSKLDNMLAVVGLPDLHVGKHAPIGAACLTEGLVYPALVGSDIGCGIGLWQTDRLKRKANQEKLVKKLANIDDQLDHDWRNRFLIDSGYEHFIDSAFSHSLGTIGGGNHFAELSQIEQIYDDSFAEQLNKNYLYLIVHSGSRGLGQSILDKYSNPDLPFGLSGKLRQQYLQEHDNACEFAKINRTLIAERIFERLKITGQPLLNVAHNFVEQIADNHFLHRKGAAPATQGLVVIAGSRGSYSYLVEPHVNQQSLFSIAHGAGRKWRRSDCKGKLTARYPHWETMLTTAQGSRVVCRDKRLAYEEAPEAYKNIDQVIACLVDYDLVNVIARLSPVLTYKTMKKG